MPEIVQLLAEDRRFYELGFNDNCCIFTPVGENLRNAAESTGSSSSIETGPWEK